MYWSGGGAKKAQSGETVGLDLREGGDLILSNYESPLTKAQNKVLLGP